MSRRIIGILLIITFIFAFGITSYASKTFDDNKIPSIVTKLIKDADTDYTDQFIVTITKPEESKDSTYKKSYIISGITEYSDVKVLLAIYDEDEKEYVPLENTDGENTWDIGKFGVFSKEITLSKGVNKIRIAAYRTSQKDKLTEGKIQVNRFTITLLNESIKDKIFDSIRDFTKNIGDLFSPQP